MIAGSGPSRRCSALPGNGAPGRIRTSGPQIRSLVLYPAELRARCHEAAGGRHRGDTSARQPLRLLPSRCALRAGAMRTGSSFAFAIFLSVAACSTPQAAPSLAPRAAEAIDPRVPVHNPVRSGPVSAGLAAHLAALLDQVQAGNAAFNDAAAAAERAAAAAGQAKSESWISAQQALSAAESARGPTTRALGDIDGLASTALATKAGMSAADMDAIRTAAARAAEVDRAQSERIRALKARLTI